jgi:hypothetical protein
MKTKIITIATVVILLGISHVQATVVFFDTADPLVMPGETISVSIFSTVETDSIRMDRISDADFGTASNLYLNPNYSTPLDEGIVVNISGVLIEGVSTGITPIFPAVSGVLYSFDYTVSEEAAYGQIISLFADLSGGAINEVWCNIGPGFRLEAITPESLSLTVVPEPITIVLLGTGSLLLARRNKRRL